MAANDHLQSILVEKVFCHVGSEGNTRSSCTGKDAFLVGRVRPDDEDDDVGDDVGNDDRDDGKGRWKYR